MSFRVISGGQRDSRLPAVGELLAVEAIDPSGLVVTSEGAFVRVLKVSPVNPLLMAPQERERIAAALQRLISLVRADETLQAYVDARPVRLAGVVGEGRREAEAVAGPAPTRERPARDDTALARWRLLAMQEESLRAHADADAATDISFYVVVPFVAPPSPTRAVIETVKGLRRSKLPWAPLQRPVGEHRRLVRAHLERIEMIRGELETEGMSTRLLDGEQVAQLLWARFNPTRADQQAGFDEAGEVLGEVEQQADRESARQAAARLRERIARSAIDFRSSHAHGRVDQDVEQTILVANTAGHTHLGWLHQAMLTRQPFTLSVFVHGLERRTERRRLKFRYRRTFMVNRAAEQHGRMPDFDRYVQESEYHELLGEMAAGDQTLQRVSIYQTLRARGPNPDLAALAAAVDFCAEAIESAADCKVSRGEFHQQRLWQTSLPLGRDLYYRARRYPTENAADCLPLHTTQCGSPRGPAFAFASPGRTLERHDAFDPEHFTHTIVTAGRGGSGKTMAINALLARLLVWGVRLFVIDRAGHYELLTRLMPGAQQIELGAEGSPYALNPWDVPDPARVSREKLAFVLNLHQLMMGGLDKGEVGLIGAAIRAVYAKAAALSRPPRESMLQEELRAQAKEAQQQDAVDVAARLRNLADRLSEYCGEGTYAYLLDRDTTVPGDAPMVVFDTRRCPESELQLVMFSIMEYVVNTVERHWRAHRDHVGRPGSALYHGRSGLVIDEAWHIISRPEVGAYANNLARRARHLGLALIVLSQQLSDFDTEHGRALLDNSSQQLLLSQNPKEIAFIADALQLTEREAVELQRLKTIKGVESQILWLNGTHGHGKVSLRFGPTEYWAFTSDPAEVAIRDQAIARHHGNVWAALAELAKQGTRKHRNEAA